MREKTCSVYIVGRDSLFLEGLRHILRDAQLPIAGVAQSVDRFSLDRATTKVENPLLVVGAGHDPQTAISEIALFKEKCPSGRVAVVARCFGINESLAAFRAGANACFLESTDAVSFVRSLQLLMLGQTIMPAEIFSSFFALERDPEPAPDERASGAAIKEIAALRGSGRPHLSPQERRVLQFLVEGASNKVIARNTESAEATVKIHVKSIFRKIRVQNRTQAAIWAQQALQNKLTSPELSGA